MIVKRNGKRRLPRRLDKFFWDAQPHRIDLNQHSEYVIARLLEHGDMGAVQWIIKAYRKAEIIKVVKHSRQLSRRTANFWRLRLAISKSAVYALKRPFVIAPEPFY